jgi:hypothetical protein
MICRSVAMQREKMATIVRQQNPAVRGGECLRWRTVYRAHSNSGLAAEDLVNAWAYARSHAAEMETQIRENEAA